MKNQQKAKNIANNIGLAVHPPKKTCQDQHCPFHASQKLRGRMLSGEVRKIDAFKTATITFERVHPLPKYERYEKRTSRLRVHNPPCLNAQPGDKVLVAETRPISKTKGFVIIEVQKDNRGVDAGVHKKGIQGLEKDRVPRVDKEGATGTHRVAQGNAESGTHRVDKGNAESGTHRVDKGNAGSPYVHKNPPGVHGRGIHENPLEVLS